MSRSILDSLNHICGADSVLSDSSAITPYVTDWRGRFHGEALAVVFPKSTAEISELVRFCQQQKISITPQGGNTNMVGSATPAPTGKNIVLSLQRMNRILECNPVNNTILVEAGATLSTVKEAAHAQNRLFPLELAPRDQCQIGGAIATNAGGLNVVRYGMMRNMVLGIEAVLANGEVFSGLNQLPKNNAGYDLKQLFIGSEGTLGLITRAALRLFPLPAHRATAMLATDSFAACIETLQEMQRRFSAELSVFEYIGLSAWSLVKRHDSAWQDPFEHDHLHYMLIELEGFEADLPRQLQHALNGISACQHRIAANPAEAAAFWRLRKTIPLAEKALAPSIKHDIAVPIDCWEQFLSESAVRVAAHHAESHIIAFGHLGDGNLHYNITWPGLRADQIGDHEAEMNAVVYEDVLKYGGSIAAEHGIGQLRRHSLKNAAPTANYRLMRAVKQTLDPENLFNPGKIF